MPRIETDLTVAKTVTTLDATTIANFIAKVEQLIAGLPSDVEVTRVYKEYP